jgi:hypothetical protein
MTAHKDAGRVPPRHVAIIMDGNGRWAKRAGLERIRGHERGIDAVRTTSRGRPAPCGIGTPSQSIVTAVRDARETK